MPSSRFTVPLNPEDEPAHIEPRGPLGMSSQSHKDTPGTLGINDRAAELAESRFLAGNKKRKRKKKRRRAKRPSVVLNFLGAFKSPWKSVADEIKVIKAERGWSPTINDFEAVAGKNSIEANTFLGMLGAIVLQKPGSIKRVNVFTHGSSTRIAFSGTVRPGLASAPVKLDEKTALTLEALEGLQRLQVKGKWYTVADVRTRFAEEARVYFFSCNNAIGGDLLRAFANDFDVTTVGFRRVICYCPKVVGSRLDRKRIGIGPKCTDLSSDFTNLDKHGKIVTPAAR